MILCIDTGANIPRDYRNWADCQRWLDDGNTPLPLVPVKSLDEMKADLVAAATAELWERETGGILISGVQVGTNLDDQNRLSGVLSAIQLGGLESVDFKAQRGWGQLTAPELQGIALAISAHVQACFTAERAQNEAIEQLQTQADVDAYDVMEGGGGHRQPAWDKTAPGRWMGCGLTAAASITLLQRGLRPDCGHVLFRQN